MRSLLWSRDTRSRTRADKRPLDLRLIRRLLGYMGPYAAKRNWLMLCVLLRAIQLPATSWAIGETIKGPITDHQIFSIFHATTWVFVLAAFTQFTFHYRYR